MWSVVKNLFSKHSGKIAVLSCVGLGLAAVVTLPLSTTIVSVAALSSLGTAAGFQYTIGEEIGEIRVENEDIMQENQVLPVKVMAIITDYGAPRGVTESQLNTQKEKLDLLEHQQGVDRGSWSAAFFPTISGNQDRSQEEDNMPVRGAQDNISRK